MSSLLLMAMQMSLYAGTSRCLFSILYGILLRMRSGRMLTPIPPSTIDITE